MGKDKGKPKMKKNPSLREQAQEEVDPTEELRKTIEGLFKELTDVRLEHIRIREQWHKHYTQMCAFFLITGLVIGFILGVILL